MFQIMEICSTLLTTVQCAVFFNGITHSEVRSMSVEADCFGAIKQSLEGSSDHGLQS